jgi:uncharacterized membrane protein YebE (DUF533 family)
MQLDGHTIVPILGGSPMDWFHDLIDLIVAIALAVNSYWTYKSKQISESNHIVGLANHALSIDIQKNTNGMQTALVAAADAAGHADGLAEGRAEVR